MATVTAYTAERMQAIEDSAIVDGNVVGDNLILVRHDGGTIDAGSVRGAMGLTGGGYFICTSTTRPSSPFEGQAIYETDTHKVLVWDGGAEWFVPRNFAMGELGYAEIVALQSGIPGGGATDITGLAVTVTPLYHRKIEVEVFLPTVVSTVDGDYGFIYIKEGGTILQTAVAVATDGAHGSPSVMFKWRGTPSEAAHTYKVAAERTIGTGDLTVYATATEKAYIHVKDIGGY